MDIEATKRMIAAGKLMNIPLLDHVVVSPFAGEYYSYLENMPEMFQRCGTEEKLCNFELHQWKVKNKIDNDNIWWLIRKPNVKNGEISGDMVRAMKEYLEAMEGYERWSLVTNYI